MNKIISKIVLEKINTGAVKMKSKYIFWAEKFGFGSLFLFTTLLAILFASLFLSYLKNTDNLYFLSMGSFGIRAFLETFPFMLLTFMVGCLLLLGFFIKKSEWTYKRSFSFYASIFLVLILSSTLFLTFGKLANAFEHNFYNTERPVGKFLYPLVDPKFDKRANGIPGVITEISGNEIVINNPMGEFVLNYADPAELNIGDLILAVGKFDRKNEIFKVKKIRKLDPSKLPKIKDRINQKFGLPKNFEIR